jgi:hypothetical protein
MILYWRSPQPKYLAEGRRYSGGVQASLNRLSFARSQLFAGIAEMASDILACAADAPKAVATLSPNQKAFAEEQLGFITSSSEKLDNLVSR